MPFLIWARKGVVQRLALMRVFHALGASRQSAASARSRPSRLMSEGHPIGVDPEETPDAKLDHPVGTERADDLPSPVAFHRGSAQARREDHRHRSAAARAPPRHCDVHLRIIPGSDADAGRGDGRHLLETGLADLEWRRCGSNDFEAYRAERGAVDLAARGGSDRAERSCRSPTGARLSPAASPALIRAGIAPQQAENGEAFVRGLSALAILGGHWRHRGGGLSILSMPRCTRPSAARPILSPASRAASTSQNSGEISTSATPPVKGLMVWSANPAVTQIDAPRVKRGLDARRSVHGGVRSLHHRYGAVHADIVLPATTQFEHFDVQGAWGHHYVLANDARDRAAWARRAAAAPSCAGLAEKLGLDHPALKESDEEIAASALPEGWPLDDLAWRTAGGNRLRRVPATALERAVAHFGWSHRGAAPRRCGRLQLLTPKSHYFLNSTFANMPRHQASQGQPAITLNAGDAARLGLVQGSRVAVKSGGEALELVLKVSDAVRPGVATMEGKWWEQDKPLAAMNLLTPSRWSPAGQPAYNEVFVTVEPA